MLRNNAAVALLCGGHELWRTYHRRRRTTDAAFCERVGGYRGAERSTLGWLPSTKIDLAMVTCEDHVVALENGGG